jgi:hypothetical protein
LSDRLAKVLDSPDPLASEEFTALRSLRRSFGRGGLPANPTPADQARLATFKTLRDLLHILDAFRSAVRRGEPVRLVVPEQEETPGRKQIEIVMERSAPEGEP